MAWASKNAARLGALLLVACALLAMGGGACANPVRPGEQGCVFDDDCASDEVCGQGGACVQVQADAGVAADAGFPDAGFPDAGSEDGGAPPQDAGPGGCVADDLGNGTAAQAAPQLGPDAGPAASGHLCPTVPEYFDFFAQSNDFVHLVARWSVDVDLDLDFYSPATSGVAEFTGASAHPRLELGTARVQQTGDQLLHLFAFDDGDVPPEGVDFEVQVRTGRPCFVDSDCASFEGGACLMPIFMPTSSTGTFVDDEIIFSGGMCAPVYEPCGAADSTSGGGITDRRSNAATGLPVSLAWSCALDEDWFRYTTSQTGDVNIGFANSGTIPGTFLLTVHDALGNMVAADGYRDLPGGQARTILVPKFRASADLFIRVMQLHDDDGGQYDLAVSETASSCASDADCAGSGTRDYGRTRCSLSACECVDNPLSPGRCSPAQ